MKKIILINLIVLAALNTFGQKPDDVKVLGDQSFANKNYYAAAFYYKEAATGFNIQPQTVIPFRGDTKAGKKVNAENNDYVSYQLAESYRLYENYLEAEGWYYKVVTSGITAKYPLARLWYGVCLRADQHFDEAVKQLQLFIAQYNGPARYKDMAYEELRNCQFAKEAYLYPALLDVNMMNGKVNNDGSDYAANINNGKRYFTSSRLLKNDKRHLNRIYTLPEDANANPQVVNFNNTNDKKEIEYGTPSIDPTGKHMYMTRWYKTGSKTIHAVYMSTLGDNGWGEPAKLNTNVNNDGFNSIQPFITADGKRLFFVSDKPGGQGGDDIWVSDIGADGLPVNSHNLGATVNSPLDEQAPYYDIVEKKLIYSSKGFTGLGGFDFFVTYETVGEWSAPKNMGYPMNSAKDDLYYLPDNNDRKKAYVSSDRESDCCLNLFTVDDKKYILKGIVTDCDAHTALAGVKMSFVDSLSKQTLYQQTSGTDGVYAFSVTTKRPYNMVLEKKGYFTKVVSAPTNGRMNADTLINSDICLQAFIINKPIVIKNILYDFGKSTLRPESEKVLDSVVKILVDNPKMKIELSSHTDSVGSDAYNQKLSQDRAQSCVDYIKTKGIPESRLFAKGYGKSRPIAPNSLPNGKDNPEGRQLNRRTEFTVLKVE
jgi:OOP family OmpA-OmpF porin